MKRTEADWKKWIAEIFDNFEKLYWVFDSRIEETHNTRPRDTHQTYQRANIRYFFSWEGLSKFLLAPVFKVGLFSIVITPMIASIYNSFGGKLVTYLGITVPIQTVLLFFSGLFVVIARSLYEIYCPKLLKSYIKINPLDEKKLQNKNWIQMELEYCLLQYVDFLPMSKEYLDRKSYLKKIRQKTVSNNQTDEIDSIIYELAPQRVGFNVYGIWLIENLLLRISKKVGCKLFVSYRVEEEYFTERNSPGELWDTSYTALYHVVLQLAKKTNNHIKEIRGDYKEGDLLLEFQETSHHAIDDFPKNAWIHNYFNGLNLIEDLEAYEIVIEFIAENQNFWNPFIRIIITFLLLLSIALLLLFLGFQTYIVVKAIL
jgi:hypothetical protein